MRVATRCVRACTCSSRSRGTGLRKTRDPRFDPPVRVTGVYKRPFGLPSWPEWWPAKPPQDWERFFLVDLAVKDAVGAEFIEVRVPYKRFAENRGWATALDLTVTQFCASRALWDYTGPTYNKEHLNFAREELEAAKRKWLEDLRAAACEQGMLGNFEAADQRAAEYEAQLRAARGPWIVEVDDEPNESLWTSEEFAEMQAATRAESERKRQAAWNLLPPINQTQPQQLSRA